MALYDLLAERFDEIFPLDEAAPGFCLSLAPSDANASILDIGCATGSLAWALAARGKRAIGIDLNREMIAAAKRSALPRAANGAPANRPEFEVLDMLEIEKEYAGRNIELVLCLGNTLPHLADPERIEGFLRQARSLLKEGDALALQMISYDRILDRRLDSLPSIETAALRFDRKYRREASSLVFSTSLLIKETSCRYEDETTLYPIRKTELEELLGNSGFEKREYYGGFGKEPFTEDSVALACVAR